MAWAEVEPARASLFPHGGPVFVAVLIVAVSVRVDLFYLTRRVME